MQVLLPAAAKSLRTTGQRPKATAVAQSSGKPRNLRSCAPAMEEDAPIDDFRVDADQRIRDKRRLLAKKLLMWSGIVLGGMAVLVACVYFPWAPLFGYFFETVEALGVWGNLLMVLAFIVISFPFTFGYIPLSLGCGYLYGVVWGTMTAGVGANSGALLCFITLSSIPMGRFVTSTVIGLMPFQIMWVYLGTTLRSLTDAANGNIEGSTAQYVSLFIQLFIGLLAPLYMAYKAYTKKPAQEEASAIEMEELGGGAADALDGAELGIPLDTFQRTSAVRLTVGADVVESPLGADFV